MLHKFLVSYPVIIKRPVTVTPKIHVTVNSPVTAKTPVAILQSADVVGFPPFPAL